GGRARGRSQVVSAVELKGGAPPDGVSAEVRREVRTLELVVRREVGDRAQALLVGLLCERPEPPDPQRGGRARSLRLLFAPARRRGEGSSELIGPVQMRVG